MDPATIATSSAWLWDKFGKELVEKTAGAAKKTWARLSWSHGEAQYKRRMLDLYSTTKLLGNPREIHLDQIYTDVTVLEKPTAMRRLSIEELEAVDAGGHWEELLGERRNLEGILKESNRLYLLGKPGAGKSTFLKHVVLQCCAGQILKTPIFVPLKQWSDSRLELMKYIAAEFDVCDFPNADDFIEKLLTAGDAIVLFDGLDEVNQEGDRRSRMIRTLTEFARKYHRVKIIVTCRIAATDYSFDRFKYLEVADFTSEQQVEFIKKWYSHDAAALSKLLSDFDEDENSGIRDLARTPLLLALLCLAYEETLSFPNRRADLYQEALNALLRKWDSSRGIRRDTVYRFLSPVRKEQLLAYIASRAFIKKQFFFPKQKLIKEVEAYLGKLPPLDIGPDEIDGIAVISAIEAQHGLLIERAHNIYAFSHLTFQEYLTARALLESADGSLLSVARSRALDDQWREVFLLTASMLDDCAPLLVELQRVLEQLVADDSSLGRLLAALERGGAYMKSDAITKSTKAPRKRLTRPHGSTSTVPEAVDLALSLAAELDIARAEGPVMARARLLVQLLSNPSLGTSLELFSTRSPLDALTKYLRLAGLAVECVQVGVVGDRAHYLDSILRHGSGERKGGSPMFAT